MTTPIDELDGQELDERLARAMGWTRRATRLEWWDRPGDRSKPYLPDYHASLDALLRDVWPVCKERGADGFELRSWGRARIRAYRRDVAHTVTNLALTPPLALARAMLAVLEAGE